MKEHKQYCMIYDMGHTVDGIEYDDLPSAIDGAEDTLVLWMTEECAKWTYDDKGIPQPTAEQINSWDQMINDCCVYIAEWNNEEQAYTEKGGDFIWLTYEDEKRIGWLYWEELKELF